MARHQEAKIWRALWTDRLGIRTRIPRFKLDRRSHTAHRVSIRLESSHACLCAYDYSNRQRNFWNLRIYQVSKLVSANRRGASLDDLLTQIGDIDRESRQLAVGLPDEVSSLILKSCEETTIGGSIFRILSGKAVNCPSDNAFAKLRGLVSSVDQEHALNTRKLLVLTGKKCGLLGTVRRDIQLKALMDIWFACSCSSHGCSINCADSAYHFCFLLLVG